MDITKKIADYVGTKEDKFYKTTLFRSDALLIGLNCLEQGQVQSVHAHDDQDKFYYVVEGRGHFVVGDVQVTAGTGEVVWAPAGIDHGVTNPENGRLTLLVGIAPAP